MTSADDPNFDFEFDPDVESTGYRIDLENIDGIVSGAIDYNFEQLPMLGDVPEVWNPKDWWHVEWQGPVGSCFPAGTLVTMADGSRRVIEEVAVGNLVVSHEGRSREVAQKFVSKHTGSLIKLSISGARAFSLKLTPEHPLLIERDGKCDWITAGALVVGDRVVLSAGVVDEDLSEINTFEFIGNREVWHDDSACRLKTANYTSQVPSRISLDENFGRFIGLFLAEGSFSRATSTGEVCGIDLTFHKDELEYQEFCRSFLHDVLGCTNAKIEQVFDGRRTQKVTCDNSTLAQFLLTICGAGCYSKNVPDFAFRASSAFRLGLLRGWLQGDGQDRVGDTYEQAGQTRTRVQADGCTTSEMMAKDLQRLSLSLGMTVGVSKRTDPGKAVSYQLCFCGRSASVVTGRIDCVNEEPRRRGERQGVCDYGYTRRVDAIEELSVVDLDVYNIEVEEDHSYIAENVVAHNCAGWAASSTGEICVHRQTGGQQQMQFQGHFSYIEAQRYSSGLLGRDSGSTIHGQVQAAKKKGFCPIDWDGDGSEDFPTPKRYTTQIPKAAYEHAAKYRIRYSAFLESFDAILNFLRGGQGGAFVGGGWGRWKPDSRGVCDRFVSGGGGHAWAIVGWDVSRKRFSEDVLVCVNSHGKNWADGGFHYITRNFVRQFVADRWTVIAGMSDLTGPEPRKVDWKKDLKW